MLNDVYDIHIQTLYQKQKVGLGPSSVIPNFSGLSLTLGYVPTCSYLVCHGSKPIRLACLIHAASIHPELGSNSKLKRDLNHRSDWLILSVCEHTETVLTISTQQTFSRIRQKRMHVFGQCPKTWSLLSIEHMYLNAVREASSIYDQSVETYSAGINWTKRQWNASNAHVRFWIFWNIYQYSILLWWCTQLHKCSWVYRSVCNNKSRCIHNLYVWEITRK